MADVLVLSLYQGECQEPGCNWTGVVRTDHTDAGRDAQNHDTAHQLRDAQASKTRRRVPADVI